MKGRVSKNTKGHDCVLEVIFINHHDIACDDVVVI